jgi:hippurate hydrolase
MGYDPQICASGIVAHCGKGKSSKTFLLRADMDALPMVEETVEPFRSINENMHACGHDLHTAMLLGCARLLKNNEDQINGTVKLMFQAGEEVILGAKEMIDAGVLKNPDVDAAMMIHVVTGFPFEEGKIVFLADGPATTNVDVFRIEVDGKGGHGAMPHETIDPINVCAHIHSSLQILNAREVVAKENFILTIGEIKGGDAPNIIPDSAYMRGTIRSYGTDIRSVLRERLVKISESVAETFRAKAEVIFEGGAPSVNVDPELRKTVLGYLEEVFPEDVKDAKVYAGGALAQITGSEDFGFVSEEVPSLMLGLITGVPEDGHKFPAHHPKATFNESSLWKGAATYVYAATKWLAENES